MNALKERERKRKKENQQTIGNDNEKMVLSPAGVEGTYMVCTSADKHIHSHTYREIV